MKIRNKTSPSCPICASATIKNGFRKLKQRTTQRYFCKSCKHSFTTQHPTQKSKTYNLNQILNSISTYNLNIPLRKISHKNQQIPKSTIHNWIKNINLPFNRLRKNITNNPIIKHRFIHHKQPFLYQYHELKLQFAKKFPALINYLKSINTSLPKDIFNTSQRISQIAKTPTTWRDELGNIPFGVPSRFPKETVEAKVVVGVLKNKINYAVELAKLAKEITKDNKQRYNIIENFMLINDTATIAVEIPVYVNNLTGHIDILQIRYHKIYILDYKPEPLNKQQTINQLKLYRQALSKQTQIPIHKFKLAFFNDKGYYEIN